MMKVDPWLDCCRRRLDFGEFLRVAAEWLAAWLCVFGTLILIVKLFVPSMWPHVLWIAGVTVPVMYFAWRSADRRRHSRSDGAIVLDRKLQTGGLLLALADAPNAHWERELPTDQRRWTEALPRIRPTRFSRLILLPLAFSVGACFAPLREAKTDSKTSRRTRIAAVEELPAMLEDLKNADALPPEEVAHLREEIDKLIEDSKDSPLTYEKWERIDTLRSRMQNRLNERYRTVQTAQQAARRLAQEKKTGDKSLTPEQKQQLERDIARALKDINDLKQLATSTDPPTGGKNTNKTAKLPPATDTPSPDSLPSDALLSPEEVGDAAALLQKLLAGLGKSLLGQSTLLETVVTCLLSRGHMLLEGLPGLGKTELVKSLSQLLGMQFRRIQFTPDLLPSDIIGSPILEESAGGRQLVFHRGPVFANLVLADEINRATPKTQSALLEAMSEQRVTVLGESHSLPAPFFVLATQNPIELEGTYPLPEAQLDRFTMKIDVEGVTSETLEQILVSRRNGRPPQLDVALSGDEWTRLLERADAVHLPRAVANYIARLVTATHPSAAEAPPEVRKFVRYGGSPRAALALAATSRAAALMAGKPNAGFDEVRRVARHVLGHRLLLDYTARLEGFTAAKLVDTILDSVAELPRPIPEDAGWLRSRTRTQFLTTQHHKERGRLEINFAEGERAVVVNGFEADIELLLIKDQNGKLYSAKDLTAGQSKPLELAAEKHVRSFARRIARDVPRPPDNLTEYRDSTVNNVSFRAYPGEVLGFIGPNGAGKTTTMRILATLDTPTSGDAFICGYSVVDDPDEVRKLLGFMPDSFGKYSNMNVVEYLDFYARAYGFRGQKRRDAVERVLVFTELRKLADKAIDTLSKGMSQRLGLGRTLIHDPDVLILDEPAAGLDPRARVEVRELIHLLATQLNKTVLISSHILTELGEICDSAAIIEAGRILASGSIDEIRREQRLIRGAKTDSALLIRLSGDGAGIEPLERFLVEQPHISDVLVAGSAVTFSFSGDGTHQHQLLKKLIDEGFPIMEFHSKTESLEDAFMAITKGITQ
eukprot:g26600.t1